MTDDDEPTVYFTPEQVEKVMDWAIGAGAMLTLMHDSDHPTTIEEAVERAHMDIHAVEGMYHDMPEFFEPIVREVAEQSVLEWEHIESEVEEFMKQIEDL